MKILSERVEAAINLATQAHEGQYRRNRHQIPYVSHSFTVGMILAEQGFGEDVVIAGLLHDVVEDTDVTIEQIQSRFGKHVAELVAAVTDPPDLPFEERKHHQAVKLTDASDEVKAIKAADVLHNLYSKVVAARDGEDIWQHLDQGPQQSIEGYEERLAALRTGWDHPIVGEIQGYLDELKDLKA